MSYVKIIVSLSSSSNTCSDSIQKYFSSSDRTKTVMRIMRTSICGKLANWVLGGHFNLLTPALMMVHLHRKPVRVTLITFNLLGNVSLRSWWKISLKYSELLSESISPKILMMNNYSPRLFTEMLCVQTPSGPVWVTHSRATGPPRTNIFQEVESSRLIDWSLSGLTKRIYFSDDHHITHNTHNVKSQLVIFLRFSLFVCACISPESSDLTSDLTVMSNIDCLYPQFKLYCQLKRFNTCCILLS